MDSIDVNPAEEAPEFRLAVEGGFRREMGGSGTSGARERIQTSRCDLIGVPAVAQCTHGRLVAHRSSIAVGVCGGQQVVAGAHHVAA